MTKNLKTALLTSVAIATVLASANAFAGTATVNKNGCIGTNCAAPVISSSNEFNNNGNYGINVSGNASNNPYDVKVNSDIKANGNIFGIEVLQNGKATFSNADDTDKHINAGSNNGIGIKVEGDNAELNFKNLNLSSNQNKGHGIRASEGGKIQILGDGYTTLDVSFNTTANGTAYCDTCCSATSGILASGTGSIVTVKDTDVTLNNNMYYGAYAKDGGEITFQGADDKRNTLSANNNGKGSFNGVALPSVAIYAEEGTINIKNMDVSTTTNTLVRGTIKSTLNIEDSSLSSAGNTALAVNNSTANVDNVSITTTSGIGISTSTKAVVDVKDSSIKTTSGTGISSSDTTVSLQNSKVETTSGTAVALSSKAVLTAEKVDLKTTTGTVVSVNNSVANIRDAILNSNSGTAVSLVTSATLNLENSEVKTGGSAFATNSGTSTANITNSKVTSTNDVLLNGVNAGTNNFNVTNSELNGTINSNGKNTNNVDLKNSDWNVYKDADIASLKMDNKSVVTLSRDSNPYKKLNLKTLNGNGGEIVLHTYFGDDTSPTDKIVVKDGGQVTGTTVLNVISTGGTGAKTVNGIEVVEAQGSAITADNGFSLKGGAVDVGAYEYKLAKGDANGEGESWYLKSTGGSPHNPGGLTKTAQSVVQEPALVNRIVMIGMNNLNKRLGEIRDNSACDNSGLWVRTYSSHTSIDDFVNSKMNVYGVEMGYDHKIDAFNLDGVLYAGIMAGYSSVDEIRMRNQLGAIGQGNGHTPSIGAYATYIQENGWFIDGTFRTFWTDFNLLSTTPQGGLVFYNPNRQMNAIELEAGKQFEYAAGEYAKWIFTPKAEMLYLWADAKSFNTSTGNDLRFGHTQSIIAKATALVGYNKKLENGMIIEPFAQVAILNDFDGETNIKYAGTNMKSDVGGFSVEIGGGLNAQISSEWAFYSDVMYEKGSKIESFSGNAGVRYTF